MKNKKIPLLAIGMLAVGVVSSVAYQSFAQTSNNVPTQPIATVSTPINQEDQNIDQRDVNGNDLETNDDTNSTTSISKEKEGVNDNDGDANSELTENDSGQGNVAE